MSGKCRPNPLNFFGNCFSFRHPVLPSSVSYSLLLNKNCKQKEENILASRAVLAKPWTIIKPKFTTNQRKSYQLNTNNILCEKIQEKKKIDTIKNVHDMQQSI